MKTTHTREAARRAARTQKTARAATTPATAKGLDHAWPGFTRAQLRDHIIEQIG